MYCENRDVSPLVTDEAASPAGDEAAGVLPYAVAPETAARLRELSECLTA